MRQLDAFSYYPQYSSALIGFGGPASAPDPRYCFHTHYEDLLPGRAIFRLTLTGARASTGELTLRVHGYRPGPDSDITLVAGARKLLATEGHGATTIELSVSFVGLQGVQYALYGFFSEPSDLKIDDVKVTVEELKIAHAEFVEVASAPSQFSNPAITSPDRLYADAEPSLHRPVSQDCTLSQLSGGRRGAASEADYEQWKADIVLSVLEQYGRLDSGAHGLVYGEQSNSLAAALARRGCRFDNITTRHDFIICSALEQTVAPELRYPLLRDRLSEALPGGLAIFFLRYSAQEGRYGARHTMTRNEIGQWALRLIGAGHDVAQLAFAPPAQRVVDDEGRTPFALIAKGGVPY